MKRIGDRDSKLPPTSHQQQQQHRRRNHHDENDDDGAAAAVSEPEFRFAQLRTSPMQAPHLVSAAHRKDPPPSSDDVIDKASFFSKPPPSAAIPEEIATGGPSSNWLPTQLRPVPAFYPLEKSSRLVEDNSPSDIALRVSECLRTLSVKAEYDNEIATAQLHTAENVEMHLSLWKTQPGSPRHGVVVELQRRKGDSIAFHRYSRSILDAAVGDWDVSTLPQEMLYEDRMMYSKKVQRLISMELKNRNHMEHENAVIAMEIAHSLLMKDRMDARQLGLESLCLLTDPRKTGYITAVLTSHVVLLGSTQGVHIPGLTDQSSAVHKSASAPVAAAAPAASKATVASNIMMDEGPFQEICEAILSLVQFSRLGDDGDDDQDDMYHDDAAVEVSTDREHMMLLHNLALAVLANALEVVENPERYEDEPETSGAGVADDWNDPEDAKPRARLRTASSTDVANDFLQQTEELSNKEILSTLISELGKAQSKPHNATLSAKCIGSLCRASDEAKRRAKELGAKNVVSTALDVGVRTHLKLETECKNVVKALERPNSTRQEQEQVEEEEQHPPPNRNNNEDDNNHINE